MFIPNFFNLIDNLTFANPRDDNKVSLKDGMQGSIVAWRSLENIRWITEGIQGYGMKGICDTDNNLEYKDFVVPLTVDYGLGSNWGELH